MTGTQVNSLLPIVSIVTPCYNAEKYLKTTIESILNQTAFLSGRAILDYIIVDGASTDNTLDIIKQSISGHKLSPCVRIISEPDRGMYDAIAKGIRLCKGEIFSYLNADDFYNTTAIDVVLDIMENNDVKWLTGLQVHYNDKGQIFSIRLPFKYRNRFIQKGFYGTKLPFIQQETTFWRSGLNSSIDLDKFAKFKIAGDYYLWFEFCKHTAVHVVNAYLGGFRFTDHQLSEQLPLYYDEMKSVTSAKCSLFDLPLLLHDYVLWKIPDALRLMRKLSPRWSGNTYWCYDRKRKKWGS
jgi:glycosyltransferase involved in cell wall biosynthesis